MEDIKFHQCVRLARFENDRTISFIPPDGAFELMTYRLSMEVKPLIWVEATVERHSRSRVDYTIKARSQFKERSTANNVEIIIPVPSDATLPQITATQGTAVYQPENECVLWKIKQFPGGKEFVLKARLSLWGGSFCSTQKKSDDGVSSSLAPPGLPLAHLFCRASTPRRFFVGEHLTPGWDGDPRFNLCRSIPIDGRRAKISTNHPLNRGSSRCRQSRPSRRESWSASRRSRSSSRSRTSPCRAFRCVWRAEEEWGLVDRCGDLRTEPLVPPFSLAAPLLSTKLAHIRSAT